MYLNTKNIDISVSLFILLREMITNPLKPKLVTTCEN
jgi:hypothetical protein